MKPKNLLSMLVAVVALVAWCGLTILGRPTRTRHAGAAVASAVASIGLVALTARAWHRVRFVQLGLSAVTVGADVTGLWYSAFSDQVRFAFVPGVGEVPPAELQRWVIVHLAAPVLTLAVFVIGWIASEPPRGPRGPRRSIITSTSDPLV